MKIFNKYTEQSSAIEELNIPFKKRFPIMALSFFYSLIILCIPTVIVANMYIFNDVRYFITGVLFFFVFALFHLTQIFYYRTITEKKLKYSYLLLFESGIGFIVLTIGCIVFLSLGVF